VVSQDPDIVEAVLPASVDTRDPVVGVDRNAAWKRVSAGIAKAPKINDHVGSLQNVTIDSIPHQASHALGGVSQQPFPRSLELHAVVDGGPLRVELRVGVL